MLSLSADITSKSHIITTVITTYLQTMFYSIHIVTFIIYLHT